jgi:hypothetical protein
VKRFVDGSSRFPCPSGTETVAGIQRGRDLS